MTLSGIYINSLHRRFRFLMQNQQIGRNAKKLGLITYDQAKKIAQPIIDEMNEKAREVAEKYGQKHRNFTFSALMR